MLPLAFYKSRLGPEQYEGWESGKAGLGQSLAVAVTYPPGGDGDDAGEEDAEAAAVTRLATRTQQLCHSLRQREHSAQHDEICDR